MPPSRPNKKVANGLLALSAAAVLAVYAAGYERTKAAADRFELQTAERRPAIPAPPAPVPARPAVVVPTLTTTPPVAPPKRAPVKKIARTTPAPSQTPAPAVAAPPPAPVAEPPVVVAEPPPVAAPVAPPPPAKPVYKTARISAGALRGTATSRRRWSSKRTGSRPRLLPSASPGTRAT